MSEARCDVDYPSRYQLSTSMAKQRDTPQLQLRKYRTKFHRLLAGSPPPVAIPVRTSSGTWQGALGRASMGTLFAANVVLPHRTQFRSY